MIVSFYHHVCTLKYHFYDDSFANYFRLHVDEHCDAEYGSYFRFEREMLHTLQPLVDEDVVLEVTFEDLKMKAVETMKRIGSHLGLERNEEFYEKVSQWNFLR